MRKNKIKFVIFFNYIFAVRFVFFVVTKITYIEFKRCNLYRDFFLFDFRMLPTERKFLPIEVMAILTYFRGAIFFIIASFLKKKNSSLFTSEIYVSIGSKFIDSVLTSRFSDFSLGWINFHWTATLYSAHCFGPALLRRNKFHWFWNC